MGNRVGTPDVDALVEKNPVMIFSATYCSYCKVVRRTLDQLGTKFACVELDRVEEGQKLAEQLAVATKETTVIKGLNDRQFWTDVILWF